VRYGSRRHTAHYRPNSYPCEHIYSANGNQNQYTACCANEHTCWPDGDPYSHANPYSYTQRPNSNAHSYIRSGNPYQHTQWPDEPAADPH
jgi:hypothetical protein